MALRPFLKTTVFALSNKIGNFALSMLSKKPARQRESPSFAVDLQTPLSARRFDYFRRLPATRTALLPSSNNSFLRFDNFSISSSSSGQINTDY
jgi:hypothetical protein